MQKVKEGKGRAYCGGLRDSWARHGTVADMKKWAAKSARKEGKKEAAA